MLVVSGLGVTLQNKTILEDVSFKAKKGITLAIVGPNGGGKSTVFRALLNLVPYTGTIRWNGKVRMGYVPQSLVSTDLPISVEEFLRFNRFRDMHKFSGSGEGDSQTEPWISLRRGAPACPDRLGYQNL